MSIMQGSIAARESHSALAGDGAVCAALSFYPEFNRLSERDRIDARNEMVLLISRLQRVNNLSPSLRSIEFSPQVNALISYLGLA